MGDLLPCPFCGSANVGEPIRRRPLQVACIDCGGEGPEAHTVDEARTRWNIRAIADDSPPPADAGLLALANRTLAADLAKVRADRDRLARVLAVEGGDEAAAPEGWVVGDPGHWRRGNLRVSRDGASGLYLFRRAGQDADPRRFKFALEAMEAADRAGGSNV